MPNKEFVDGHAVKKLWSVKNDGLFDPADAAAAVFVDATGQRYLMVEHWSLVRHVLRIASAEAKRIIATNNHRLVFWGYLAAQIEAADQGDWEKAERLQAEMHLKWEGR